MKTCILERVVFREPRKDRLRWGIALAHREGLSLLFVQSPDEESSHALVLAAQNVPRGCYEEVKAARFPIEGVEGLMEIGTKLQAIGEQFSDAAVQKFFFPREEL
jgi:hypothetical protein